MDRRNLNNLGDEIKDIVQNAVTTMNFQQLNKDIGNTVNSALDEVKKSIGIHDHRNNSNNPNWSNPYGNNPNLNNHNNQTWNNQNWDNQTWNNRNWQNWGSRNRNHQNWNRSVPPMQQQRTSNSTYAGGHRNNAPVVRGSQYAIPVGRVSSILYTVFGSIGIGLFGIGILVLGILANVLYMSFLGTIAFGILPLFIISLFVSTKGRRLRSRLKRFNQYFALFRNRNYCTIKELSSGSGLSEKYILKDIRKMISIGMFPEGRIDEQKTCFMLNNESYDQYLKLQESIRMKRMEELDTHKEEESQKKAEAENNTFINAIEEGKSYIRQIKEANDAIPGEEISNKLSRLETVTGKIFDYVKLHPEQISEIQKFMEYYLPTTLKLLNAYKEFENQPVQGENISTAKKEIEGTLDTINLAFENLLDSLFEDVAMDISTDISVLQTMLAQEGLTERDFNTERN